MHVSGLKTYVFFFCIGVYVTNVCLGLILFSLKKGITRKVTCVVEKAFNSYRQEPLAATDQRERSRNSYHL